MDPHPRVFSALQREVADWRLWAGRAVVLGFAILAGLTVVGFTWLTEHALAYFSRLNGYAWWLPLLWTPACTAAIVWLTRRFAPGAAGSGIPQVMAAMTPGVPPAARALFVSIRLSVAKMLLTAWGLLAGLSLGREGPSVQIAAGVMHHARRWLPRGARVSDYGLLLAGGAAGIAAAFNTPLGGVMFAIEELARKPEQRSNGLVLAAIVLGGLMAVSVYGNATYFGVIRVENLGWALLLPGLLVAVLSGAAGGLFARLLAVSLAGSSNDRFSRWRKQSPVWFAAGCGLLVALLGCASQGTAYGSGYGHTRAMLEGAGDASALAPLYVLLKFCATWITSWAGVPGGIFAPSLAIGGALGNDIAQLTHYTNAPTLIALGMVGFLAAVTQAPMTSFIIVMEMVDGHGLVLSLMASALVASGVSRLVSAPLYASLASLQLQRLPEPLAATLGSSSHH
jgi:H+/Cl- antiporter ClcA